MVIKYMIYLFKQKRVHDIIPSWRWMHRVAWGELKLGWTLCFCPRVQHRLPRIMESFSLGKTSKLTQSNHYSSTAKPITDLIPRCHIHTSFKSLQEQWILHFLGSLFQFLTTLSVNRMKYWPQKSMEKYKLNLFSWFLPADNDWYKIWF